LIKEAIILAGGLGTRLRETIPDLPKCMAPVAGRPFLFYVVNELRMQGVERFIFSLGYKHEVIESYLDNQFPTLEYATVIEKEPLGTGGAILFALQKAGSGAVVIANGDTLFKVDLNDLADKHIKNQSECTLALKPMKDFDRYGVMETGSDGQVTSFKEKQFYKQGNINGGVYILDPKKFKKHSWPQKFSFEKDYLEKQKSGLYAFAQDVYFIDIGIPEDYQRAQDELKIDKPDLKAIDKTWTIFIDRDGVINHEKDGGYILDPGEFIFYDGVPESFRKIADKLGRIIIVSNQRGVGRGLMTENDLAEVHRKMKTEIELAGGRIDDIYYCTDPAPEDPNRKPNPGMAAQAKRNHPEIDLRKSIMVGNNISDMLFARNAGMHSVFVKTTHPEQLPHPDIDLIFNSLPDFVKAL